MTKAMTELDEATGATSTSYHHTRVVRCAGRTVRASVERDHYINQSSAAAEVLTDQLTWTTLATDAPGNWWYDTPTPSPKVDVVAVLGKLTERLLNRAAEILDAPPAPPIPSRHVHDAISALLATAYGFDAERCIEPDDIAWAYNHGGALHIIEHPDGGVTFTKAHQEACPFITSAGTQDCDENCSFPGPAGMNRATRPNDGRLRS